MKRLIGAGILLLLVASCAHVISKENVDSAVQGVDFSQLSKNPEKYFNGLFILGGTIVETRNTKTATEMEVIENPIDKYGSLRDADISSGRLLLTTQEQLDPLIYKTGRFITFAGRLTGTKKKTLGEMEYVYPLFEAREIYLWKEDRYLYPYYYRDPLMYPYPYYFYDPFWYRPYWYP